MIRPSRLNVRYIVQHAAMKFEPFGQGFGSMPSLKFAMLSMVASTLNAGSKRSTSGENVAENPLVGGILPLNIPVAALMVGTGASGLSATLSLPDRTCVSWASSSAMADFCGVAFFVSPELSSEVGPDFRLLISNAVTL